MLFLAGDVSSICIFAVVVGCLAWVNRWVLKLLRVHIMVCSSIFHSLWGIYKENYRDARHGWQWLMTIIERRLLHLIYKTQWSSPPCGFIFKFSSFERRKMLTTIIISSGCCRRACLKHSQYCCCHSPIDTRHRVLSEERPEVFLSTSRRS